MAFIQAVGVNDIAGASTTITVNITATKGNMLICCGRDGSPTDTVTVSDNSGTNTWIAVTANVADAGNVQRTWYCQNKTTGTFTVTATFSNSTGFRAISCAEYSNIDFGRTNTLNASATGQVNSSTSVTSGAFTTNAPTIVITMGTVNSTTEVFSPGLIGGVRARQRTSNSDQIFLSDIEFNTSQSAITAQQSGNAAINWMQSVGAFVTTPTYILAKP